jgi:hypothetical protein
VGGEAAGVVASAECGLTVNPSDGAALARAVRRLIDDPALCRTLGEKGKRCARERFSRDSMMADYFEMIDSLAPKVRTPAAPFKPSAVMGFASSKPWKTIAGHLLRMVSLAICLLDF